MRAVTLRQARRVVAAAPLGRIGEGLSPFPFLLVISQHETEALLREALASNGVGVEWNTRLVGLTQQAAQGSATLQRGGEFRETVQMAYVAGCDGGHSAVRHALGIDFAGGTYEQMFFVADTQTEGLGTDAATGRRLEISLAPHTFYGFFPMPAGRTRIVGLLPAGVAPEQATFADVLPALERAEGIRVADVSWFSTYRVHHRVAQHFRQGRVFLIGDAAHVHSPAGGQGMNTGMVDAVNLGWKLAAVLRHTAPDALLDTYEAERMPFARQLVATTDRAFSAAVRPTAWASFVRQQLVPRLMPLALRLGWVRRFMFRTISQVGIAYPDSPLSQGGVRALVAGSRMPWREGRYRAFRPAGWHVLAFGPPAAELVTWARAHEIKLTALAPEGADKPGTVCLVRPDTYVGLVADAFNEPRFSAYARQWGLGGTDPWPQLQLGSTTRPVP
ncbi:MAG: FAD-dependent monooxygenase [Hymenobacter sp.]